MVVKGKNRDVPVWANHVRRLRRATGRTLADFGALFDVSYAAIAQWERGLACPTPDKWLRMSVIAASYEKNLAESFARLAQPILDDAMKLAAVLSTSDEKLAAITILKNPAYIALPSAAPPSETLGTISLPRWLFPQSGHLRLFGFEVNDNSMSPLMFSGDLAIAMRMEMGETDAPLLERSLVVAAHSSSGFLARRLHLESGVPYLRDERENKLPLRGTKWNIVGQVLLSIRRWI